MSSLFQDHLAYPYGGDVAERIVPRVQRLVNEHRARLTAKSPRPQPARVSERDCLLIPYGDQVRKSGIAPRRSLAEFAEKHLSGVISGIHILPFYPYSSDDGFSVKDYSAVDPVLGSWDDIERPGAHFDLMFDAVFNHMSAQSEWFQRFLQGDPKYRDFFVTVEGNPELSQVVRPRALPLLTGFQTASGLKKVWTTHSARR